MQVYLLRHGIAEPGSAGMPDSTRALVPEGRKKLREVLRVAKDAGVEIDVIVTSPYVRAKQTAEIAANVLGFKGELFETPALTPVSAPEAVWDEIRVHHEAGKVLLVGHEPLFSQLAAYLLNAPTLLVDFKKGALLRIDFDQIGVRPRGVLRWFLPPKLAGEF